MLCRLRATINPLFDSVLISHTNSFYIFSFSLWIIRFFGIFFSLLHSEHSSVQNVRCLGVAQKQVVPADLEESGPMLSWLFSELLLLGWISFPILAISGKAQALSYRARS